MGAEGWVLHFEAEGKDKAGAFLRATFGPTLDYAARIASQVAYEPEDVDKAMRWGFAWEIGPLATQSLRVPSDLWRRLVGFDQALPFPLVEGRGGLVDLVLPESVRDRAHAVVALARRVA